jgi:hypothetical protein
MTHQDECPATNDLTALLIEHGPTKDRSANGASASVGLAGRNVTGPATAGCSWISTAP